MSIVKPPRYLKDAVKAIAKTFLRSNYEKGCECPACGQLVKAYKRNLNANMAKALILIYRLQNKAGGDYIHVQQEFSKLGLVATGMDYIQLARWGFIVPKLNDDDPSKKDSGLWRITTRGIAFIIRETAEPKYCLTYNNVTQEWANERINIKQALGKKFDFREVWNLV